MARREWVHIVAGEDFRRAANALRVVDERMPTELRKAMRNAVRPAVARTKSNARSLPTPSNAGSTGLRRRVARGVKIQAKVGSNPGVRVVTSMNDPSEAAIPRGLDSPDGWRHPVYGNNNVWVRQPGFSWFREEMADSRDEVRNALVDVLQWAGEYVDENT